MNFIIQETGEPKEIHFTCVDGCDWADKIAGSCGFDRSKFAYDDDKDAFIAPKDVVEYWIRFFEIYKSCDEKLRRLKDTHGVDEVDEIFCSEMPAFDIDAFQDAVERTEAIFRERYDTESARLISSYEFDVPKDDWRYFKESLYQRDDGSYFLTGEGGPMSGYGYNDGRGNMCYGHGSHPVSEVHAKAWIANPGAFSSLGVWHMMAPQPQVDGN